MSSGGPHIAAAAGGTRLDGWQIGLLVVGIVLLFLVGLQLVQYVRARRAKARRAPDERIRSDSLLAVWNGFLDKQPPAARPLVSRYPWVVVMGETGAGKTTLIEAKADTRSQLLNDFPSYTDDPLLKLYLGRRAVVHELGAELLSDNTVGVKLALSALWKPLCRTRPPLVVLVLSLAQLGRATPAELRAQALRLASRIKLLSRLRGAPILVRVGLSHLALLDGAPVAAPRPEAPTAASGSESLARLLSDRRIPLTLDMEGLAGPAASPEPAPPPGGEARPDRTPPGPLARRFLGYAAHLKFGLPSLPGGGFEGMVAALASAPQALLPVETLLAELLRLCEETTPRGTPALQLDRLYLLPQAAELQRANPLLVAGVSPPRLSPALHYRGLRGLWLALRTSNILSSWHAALCLVLVVMTALFCGSVYLNHRQAVLKLGADCARLVENISEAKKASDRPGDSPVVWRDAHQAATSLQAVADAERYWPLLARTLRAEKQQARGQFVESVRRLYFEPLLADNQQRAADGALALKLGLQRGSFTPEDFAGTETAMSKVIYALGAWSASPHSALADLVRKEPTRWASTLEMPEETLLRYVDVAPKCVSGNRAQRQHPPTSDSSLANSQARWFTFIDHVKTAMASPPVAESAGRASKSRRGKPAPPSTDSPKAKALAALQREALPLLSVLQLSERIARVGLLREIAVGLAEECQQSVADQAGPFGSLLKMDRWLEQNKQALTDIATLVLKSEVKPVDCSEPSAEDLLAQLGALATKPASPTAPARVYTVRLVSPQDQQEKTLQVSERDWEALLVHIRREMLLACWHADAKPRHSHHRSEKPGRSAKPEKEPRHHRRHHVSAAALLSGLGGKERDAPASSGGCGGPGTPVELLDPYNKESFERKEKPPRVQFDKAVADAGLPPSEQARLAATMIDSTRSYGRAYREKLQAALVSYGVRADSAAALHAAVIEMMLVDSAFQTHLRKIADNANLGDLSGPYLVPLAEQLAPFRPIIRLTTPNKDGGYPDFDAYRSLLAQLAGAIDTATTPEGGPELPLREAIPGIGRVALAMLAEEEASPLLQTQRWLDKAGILPELRAPFLAPMRRALCLGRRVVEQAVEARWAKVHAEQVKPLYTRFPFDRSAQEDVPLPALSVIHPKDGSLWRFVREDLGPFVQVQSDGRVTARRLPGGTVRLPSDLLPILNHLQQLGRRLWDAKEGTQRALDLRVRPLLLEGDIGRYSVSRAYLSVGSAAAVGYNQMPADRALPVSWWNQENASAGIDLAAPDSTPRLHASVDETKSAWSLFRLLRKGSLSADRVATFQIPVQLVDAKGSVAVKFVFSEDPFDMFQPPKTGR